MLLGVSSLGCASTSGPVVRTHAKGIAISIHSPLEDPYISGLFFRGKQWYHEDTFRVFIQEAARRRAMVVDAGANIGSLTLLLAARSIPVIAFEPNPRSRRLLNQSLCLNRFDTVELRREAICEASHPSTLHLPRRAPFAMSSLHPASSNDVRETVQVPCVSGDDALYARLVSKTWMLKLDIEGSELLVLRGFQRLFRDNAPALLHIEVFPQLLRNGSVADMERLLRRYFRCPRLGQRKMNVLCHRLERTP